MTRDSERSHVHLAVPRSILFFEEWMKLPLEYDTIYIPPELEPPHLDDSAGLLSIGPGGARGTDQLPFGIPKSMAHREKTMAWKELALAELLTNGPHNLVNREEMVDFAPFVDDLKKELPDITQKSKQFKLSSSLQNESKKTFSSSSTASISAVSAASKRLHSRGSRSSTSNMLRRARKSRLASDGPTIPQLLQAPSTTASSSSGIPPFIATTPHTTAHSQSLTSAIAASTPFHTNHSQMPPPPLQIRRANHIRRTPAPFRTPGPSGHDNSILATAGDNPAFTTPSTATGERFGLNTGMEREFNGPASGSPDAMTPTAQVLNERRDNRLQTSMAGRRRRNAPR